MIKKIICLLPLLFFLISCSDDEERNLDKVDKSALGKKSREQIGSIKILIPNSFESTDSQISLTNDHVYHDRKREIYFTIDEFASYQIDKYRVDYPEIIAEDSDEFTLNLAVHLRRSDQIANQLSHTKEGKNMVNRNYLMAIVDGQEYYDSETLSYVYATTTVGGNTYLFQFICATNNLKFYYSEFKEIFESVNLSI